MPAAPPRAKLLAGANSTELGQVFIGDLRAADIGSGTILELCGIPAGSFTMGGLGPTETLHRVTLTKPFWMGLTQVTVGQWQALFRTKPNSGLSLPITDVSWNEALEFCDKLNSKNILPAGWEWTLPTEAQWEYACRAGTTGDFAGMLDEMAWYSANAARNPHPIAKKKPNAWGLYDMHGNVWEWCADYYGSYLSAPVTDPTGPKSGNARVNRGGGFCDTAEACRSARRDSNGPGCQSRALGFRVAIVTKIY